MAELLLKTDLTEEQKNLLNTIITSGKALYSIVNDILDFSKIEAGRMELENTSFNLHELIEETVVLFGEAAHKKGLEINWIIDPKVPAIVKGDPHRIRQILINLIGNSVKFTEKGEVICVVYVEGESKKAENVLICFEIKDTGIGIPQEKLHEIFDPFTQADGTTTRRFGGTGLGLAICKRLTQLMDGDISVKSSIGVGTCFTVKIPFEIVSSEIAKKDQLERLNDLKIILVSSNESTRLQFNNLFISVGCNINFRDWDWIFLLLDDRFNLKEDFDLLILDINIDLFKKDDLVHQLKALIKKCPSKMIFIEPLTINISDKFSYKKIECLVKIIKKPIKRSLMFSSILEIVGEDIPRSFDEDLEIEETSKEKIFKGIKVLVVEDNEVNQLYAKEALKTYGCEVDIAESGTEALDKLQNNIYDIVFMDCQMPDMDGYETTKKLRKMEEEGLTPRSYTPVIALTAHATKDDRDKCIMSGMDEYLAKPYTLNQLYEILMKFISIKNNPKDEHNKENDMGEVDENVLDISAIKNLLAVKEDNKLITKLVDLYLNRAPQLIEEMRKAIQENNIKACGDAAHNLKSTSGTIGAKRVFELSFEVMERARKGEKISPFMINEIEQEFLKAKSLLINLINKMN